MIIYQLLPILDNPLFTGLGVDDTVYKLTNLLAPSDWNRPKKLWTWEPPRLKGVWPDPPPRVKGFVRSFNDYPCINLSTPAFSQRAVDILGELLEPYGELLPLQHDLGMYYFYNCLNVINCLDLEKSVYSSYKDGTIGMFRQYAFIEDLVRDQTFFRIRPEPDSLLCNDVVEQRVKKHGMLGFRFVPLWSPHKKFKEYLIEDKRTWLKTIKLRPKEGPALPVKGNTVVLRLYTEKKKASRAELEAAEAIMSELERRLYDPKQTGQGDYYGNVEGHDRVDHELRIFLSAPDCDKLVERLRTYLKKLPWRGRYQVLKRYGEYVDETAREVYVRL